MHFLEFPFDILADIIRRCEPGPVTETCRTLASVAYSMPSFWSYVRLTSLHFSISETPQILSRRLKRTRALPLFIDIGPLRPGSDSTDMGIVMSSCTALSHCNTRIDRLWLTAQANNVAGFIVNEIFRGVTFPMLQELSIRVERDNGLSNQAPRRRLSDVLVTATEVFPQLKFLALSDFKNCVPFLQENASFRQLHTLILDGSLEGSCHASFVLIAALLHNTPQLECFWFKTKFDVSKAWTYYPASSTNYQDREISFLIRLPRLTSLAVSAPGCAAHILACIEAPLISDLHIGVSLVYRDRTARDRNIEDIQAFEAEISKPLKRFASRTSSLRRLATTGTYLGHQTWEWLLFGDEEGLPFPHLESISIHDLHDDLEYEPGDEILLRFSENPTLPLRRLALLGSNLNITGAVLVQVFESIVAQQLHQSYELEFDPKYFLLSDITNQDLLALTNIGVKVVRNWEYKVWGDQWWEYGHRIDAMDKVAY